MIIDNSSMGSSVLRAAFATCLVIGLSACDSGDDNGGDPLPGDGTGGDGQDGGDDGGDGGDGTGGDGGGDGTGGDDGGDDGGGGGPVDCANPATGEHTGHFLFEGADPDTSIADGVRKITGELIITETNLTNLDFLACLEEVGGRINVFDNDQLTDLGGLAGITTIADPSGELAIGENDGLTTIAGLGKLGSVGSLSINDNSSLKNVDGLGGLTTVNQNLTIRYNAVLSSLDGLSSLTTVGNKFNVVGNPMLPCGNIAKIGDNLSPPPREAVWCEGNQGCEALPACQ